MTTDTPVRLSAVDAPDQPDVTPALQELYRGFEQELLVPLWTEIGDLMPLHPRSKAQPHLWRWGKLLPLAERAGGLVPVGRGGERRAIALANPSLGGRPYASPTLWAAIQYLMPGEDAPEHRHTQHAFRFVVEGEGVWTVVGRDPVPMRRGDFLPQAGWNWHAHHNATERPMAWVDGLDIPFQYAAECQFFEFGRDELTEAERATPDRSRSERLWSHPGLTPVGVTKGGPGTPLLAYRWVHTDRALADQLELEAEGFPGVVEPGHAVVRFTDPATGCTGSGGVPRPRLAARSARRSSRSSTAPAPSRSGTTPGPSVGVTCSSCPPGSRSRSGPRRAATTPTPGRWTCSGSPTPRSSPRSTATGWRWTHEARDPADRHRHPRRAA